MKSVSASKKLKVKQKLLVYKHLLPVQVEWKSSVARNLSTTQMEWVAELKKEYFNLVFDIYYVSVCVCVFGYFVSVIDLQQVNHHCKNWFVLKSSQLCINMPQQMTNSQHASTGEQGRYQLANLLLHRCLLMLLIVLI